MTFDQIVSFLTLLSPAILIVGIGIGIYYYKDLNIVNRGILYYLIVMLTVDNISRICGYSGNNLIVLIIYSLIEMLLFVYFYYKYLFKAQHHLIMVLCFISTCYIVGEILFYKTIEAKQFQTYSKVVDDFTIIVLALGFFHEKINKFRELKWDNFSLNAVILAFFSINMIFFLPINFLINEKSGIKHYFWISNLFCTILFYSYLTWSIWKNGSTRKQLAAKIK